MLRNIDDAIKKQIKLKIFAEATDDKRAKEEHEQIAEWLEELKDYRDKNKMVVRVDCENMDSIKDKIDELSKYAESQYNKAIDDFADKAIKIVYEANNRDRNPQPRDMVADIHYKLLEIAEQLKAGVGNGT